jgi:nitrite reductase/ring-hydroxylating ferredoxin subunit
MSSMVLGTRVVSTPFIGQRSTLGRRSRIATTNALKSTGVTKDDVKSADGGRMVVTIDDQKVLLTVVDDAVYAVSNKCSHLGLPLVGKTAMMQGQVTGGCIVCPAHGTAFDVKNGEVVGEWCPNMPNLPLVGKMTKEKPLPTFSTSLDENSGVISVDM